MAEALCSLLPDIIVLTEYVPGPSHENFVTELKSSGRLKHILMSAFKPGENHVLIAARTTMVPGSIKGPSIAPSVPSNCLHVRLQADGLDVLGLRVPDYSKQPRIRQACWDWIESTAKSIIQQPSIILGDFNTDPNYPAGRCGNRIGDLIAAGWQHALPDSGVSYIPAAGGKGRRLDHAFVSPHYHIYRADYIWESSNYTFAGKKGDAMSDHAALIVEIAKI